MAMYAVLSKEALLRRLPSDRQDFDGYIEGTVYTGVSQAVGLVKGSEVFDLSGIRYMGYTRCGYAYNRNIGGAPIHLGRVVYF